MAKVGMGADVVEAAGHPARQIDLAADVFGRLALDENGDSALVRYSASRRSDSAISRLWYLPTRAMVRGERRSEASVHGAEFLHKNGFARWPSRSFLYNRPMLDERARTLLKTLVERYIADGQPVGSRALSKFSGLDLSPATIRNVMADLEENGLHRQPAHLGRTRADAARLPPLRRQLLTVQPLEARQMGAMEGPAARPASRNQMISQRLATALQLTHFAGVVMAPRRQPAASARSSSSACPKSASC
jgi:hypothetical protein